MVLHVVITLFCWLPTSQSLHNCMYLVICLCVVEEELEVSSKLLHIIVLLHLQLLLELHHVDGLGHDVVVVGLISVESNRSNVVSK